MALPHNPLALIRLVEHSATPVLLGVIAHPAKMERDTFDEIVTTLQHLYKRRLRPNPRDKTVAKRRTAYLTGITSRDFHDVFRQYMLFSHLGCVAAGGGGVAGTLVGWAPPWLSQPSMTCLSHHWSPRLQ